MSKIALIQAFLEQLPAILAEERKRTTTQLKLAEKLGTYQQQIQKDEKTLYQGASLGRLKRIADAIASLQVEAPSIKSKPETVAEKRAMAAIAALLKD